MLAITDWCGARVCVWGGGRGGAQTHSEAPVLTRLARLIMRLTLDEDRRRLWVQLLTRAIACARTCLCAPRPTALVHTPPQRTKSLALALRDGATLACKLRTADACTLDHVDKEVRPDARSRDVIFVATFFFASHRLCVHFLPSYARRTSAMVLTSSCPRSWMATECATHCARWPSAES
jgi:hypothetical protein